MLKVVFDTNIYISALHFQGSIPKKILELGLAHEYQILISTTFALYLPVIPAKARIYTNNYLYGSRIKCGMTKGI